MKKEEIDREQILKYFSQALVLKNKVVSEKAQMLEMYDEEGFLKPRYNSETATKVMDNLEKTASEFEEAFASYKGCFNISLKEYAEYVAENLKKNYSARTALKIEKIPNSEFLVVKLELKTEIPELGLGKKDCINLAVIDKKFNVAKTNILKSFFSSKGRDIKIPLLHYRSEDSVLLVTEEKNEYSTNEFLKITKDFMEENYLPNDYEADFE